MRLRWSDQAQFDLDWMYEGVFAACRDFDTTDRYYDGMIAAVEAKLAALKAACADESVNLVPLILEAVEAYATEGEICGVMRQVFGEFKAHTAL